VTDIEPLFFCCVKKHREMEFMIKFTESIAWLDSLPLEVTRDGPYAGHCYFLPMAIKTVMTLFRAVCSFFGGCNEREGGRISVQVEAVVQAALVRERGLQDARNAKVLELLAGKASSSCFGSQAIAE